MAVDTALADKLIHPQSSGYLVEGGMTLREYYFGQLLMTHDVDRALEKLEQAFKALEKQ